MTRFKVFRLTLLFTFVLSVRSISLEPLFKSEIGYFVETDNFGSSNFFKGSVKTLPKSKRNSPYKVITKDGELRYLNHNYGPDDIFSPKKQHDVTQIPKEYFDIKSLNEKNLQNAPLKYVTDKSEKEDIKKQNSSLISPTTEYKISINRNKENKQLKLKNKVRSEDPVTVSESTHSEQVAPQNIHQETGNKYTKYAGDKHGVNSDKGYKNKQHKYESDNEKYKKNYKKDKSSEKGGKYKKYEDEGNHYSKYQEDEKAQKSSKFGEKKGHKKGHKTKEYHNTLHRDEYHKEHRFYDDAHKSGYHEKHGDHHSYYDKKEGSKRKGGSENSGHENEKYGKSGHTDKGKSEKELSGESSKDGYEKYHNKYRKNKHSNDHAHGKRYGYSKGK